jgi:Zn-dependent peptidase ImmA (M78 family)
MTGRVGDDDLVFVPTRLIADRDSEWLAVGTMVRRLRAMMPDRPLHRHEAYMLAERQAMTLLAVCGIDRAPVPVEVIEQFSAVTVRWLHGAPVAGASFWSGSSWVIIVDTDQCPGHQRVTVAHEFKHVIDHCPGGRYVDDDFAEAIAEFFARCVLMPRPWVKAAIGRGHRRVDDLQRVFGVAPATLIERLDELGLSEAGVDRGRFRWRGRSRRGHRGCHAQRCRHQVRDRGRSLRR